jgi:hypothetical protein
VWKEIGDWGLFIHQNASNRNDERRRSMKKRSSRMRRTVLHSTTRTHADPLI